MALVSTRDEEPIIDVDPLVVAELVVGVTATDNEPVEMVPVFDIELVEERTFPPDEELLTIVVRVDEGLDVLILLVDAVLVDIGTLLETVPVEAPDEALEVEDDAADLVPTLVVGGRLVEMLDVVT